MKSNLILIQVFRYLVMVIVAGFLGGCSSMEPTLQLPTLIPTEYLSTAIFLTSEALVQQEPSVTPELMLTQPDESPAPAATVTSTLTATATPTSTPTPDIAGELTATPAPPFEIPFANIQFIKPGALSKVVSPIDLHVFLRPGDNGRARVELFGEDGRLMYRKLFVFDISAGIQSNLRVEIDYEITGVAETATLVVSVDDAYGRVKALASQDLILLSLGNPDINPSGDLLETIVIQEPTPKVLVQGKGLVVSGLVRTASDLPLLVELVTTDGRVIGSRLAGIAPGPGGEHRLFAAEVPFAVYSPTWVRVVVSERNHQLGGTVQLNSVEVLLAP